jgi:hypothetical protein
MICLGGADPVAHNRMQDKEGQEEEDGSGQSGNAPDGEPCRKGFVEGQRGQQWNCT